MIRHTDIFGGVEDKIRKLESILYEALENYEEDDMYATAVVQDARKKIEDLFLTDLTHEVDAWD